MPTRTSRLALLSSALLVALLLASVLPAAAAEPPVGLSATQISPSGRITAFKSASARLAESDADLVKRTDADVVNVVIKLDYDAIASYAGGVDDLAATSPRVTGKSLTGRSRAETRYLDYVKSVEASAVKAIKVKVPSARIGQSLRTVYGGISATIPARDAKDLLKIDGVVAVQTDSLRQLLTDSSSEFIDAVAVQQALGGTSQAGSGVIYGNLDSGVWPEHPGLADQGNLGAPPAKGDGTPRTCDFGDNPLTPAADVFACNNKLIGGRPFLATYLSSPTRAAAEPYKTARDSNGHGTHTTTTSAGNALDTAQVLGVDRGPINGVAPGAWVSVYKVCGIAGCYDSDSAAAVQQAILDGVKVINFSISGGTDPFSDPVELAFLDAYAAGVFVSTSAGNDGPGAATANHLSPWVMTVAASTQTREFVSTLTVNGTGGATATFEGASVTAGAGPLPVVLSSAAPYSDNLCQAPAPAGIFTGKIVACQRGTNNRVDKGYNVLQGGAAGMILYNPALADIETDNHWLPTVHLADGTAFKAFMTANPGATASFTAGAPQDGLGDAMAAFSSRGPAGLVLKPDVTAPGVQILAGHTPTPESITEGPPGQYFQAIAGTSMSSPHVAGSGLLLKALHPSWTPGQIKSALMATATTDVVKEDLATPADPFDMGSGRIDVDDAGATPLTLDESAADMFALGGDPLTAIHLNIPSINAPVMPGRVTTTRVVKNVTSGKGDFRVSTTAPAGSEITVSPSKFKLDEGESATLTITIESDAPLGTQQFGEIRIAAKKGATVHLPVAFIHTQGEVSLSQSCTPASISVGATTECDIVATNLGFDEQTVDLTTTVNNKLKILSADGATLSKKIVHLDGITLAGAQPGIPDVGAGELFGYIPLTAFGVTPAAIGDEEIINYNIPAFDFHGETYTSVGVDSNGYIVAGGASSEDNNCCNLPTGPNAAPPNNVLAPFWTDLDGTGSPGIYAAILADGPDSWFIAEYQVRVFGTTAVRAFQVWIGLNGTEDITYAYAAPQTDPAGQDFLVGAENQLGQGDMTAVLPTADLRVTSTDPIPGDSATYSIIARGQDEGTGLVTTTMDASGVLGSTIVKSKVTITE
ncbi:MAG TPA: S8 family serine peptidase [Candidatus Saccharimonadales bacterium]|nr:S8 family serine peptidase [Candidatus Saccharimonadales bacterium]